MQDNKSSSYSQSIKMIWPYIVPYKNRFFFSLFMTTIRAVSKVLEPFIFGLIITELTNNILAIIQGKPGAGINYSYVLMMIGIYYLRGFINDITQYLSVYYMTEAVQKMTYDLRNSLTRKLNHLPVAYFDRKQYGDILNRMTNDMETIANGFQISLIQIFNAIIQLLLIFLMMIYIRWQFALLMVLIVLLSFLGAKILLSKSQPYFDELSTTLGKMNGFVQENLSGFDIIKLYGQEENSKENFRKINEELTNIGFKGSFISGLIRPLLSVIAYSAYLFIAFAGGVLVIQRKLTVGNLQAFTQYIWQINEPLQIVAQMSATVQSASSAINRVFLIINEDEEVEEGSIELKEPVRGRVTFDQVGFAYSPGQKLIENFNIDIEPGQTVAIVGPTGAGKTTIVNLLMRFYDVDQGAIKIDGIDIRSIKRNDYRQQFAMVLQDPWLFKGTIKENLRFGNLHASDEDIVQAAKISNIDHFIRTLPGGYNHEMNEESSNISQGQKQLLTIARALLADPKILILDEATSSVDTRLEVLIQDAMTTLMEGRTSFVIAHRLSTIVDANLILVMNKGNIVEKGTHQDLLASEGLYADLYNSQFINE